MALSGEQKDILSYFENLEKEYNQQPIPEKYLLEPEQPQQVANAASTSPLFQPAEFQSPYSQIYQQLKTYTKNSNSIEAIGELVHQYENTFEEMIHNKNKLMEKLEEINKQSCELVEKQKKYIDMSLGVKEALDYYLYMDKFQFQWACEVGNREVFEDQLQPILSELSDGIQFFSQNPNYTSAKKYLGLYNSNKSKVTSFTKSFFIKLLNKEFSYSIKNSRSSIWKYIDNFYPKSKYKFIYQFLTCYPQFLKDLSPLTKQAKYGCPEEETHTLEMKELQIEQFQLTSSSLGLISYMQANIPDLYEEVILKFICFYRTNFHETLQKNIVQTEPKQQFSHLLRQRYISIAYILFAEYAYLSYCFRTSGSNIAKEYIRTTITKISQYYVGFLVKFIKDPKNKEPFQLCLELTILSDDVSKFIKNYLSGDYESYALGAVSKYVEESEVQFLSNTLEGILNKLKNQLEPLCHRLLPKISLQTEKKEFIEQVRVFLRTIPQLKFCPNTAEKYLIGCLDIIVKSLKTINTKIESRVESYALNIEVFAAIEQNLEKIQVNIVKKQIRIDMHEPSSLFQRVKQVDMGPNLFQYATDVFRVLSTGVPTLNELTLDFGKFVTEYYAELRDKFRKDMIFIHGKNMIEFLQGLQEEGIDGKKQCDPVKVKALYNGYLFSLEHFLKQANIILKERQQYSLLENGNKIFIELLLSIWEALLDLVSTFYVQVSKNGGETQNFLSISEIREKNKQNWLE